MYCKLQGRQI